MCYVTWWPCWTWLCLPGWSPGHRASYAPSSSTTPEGSVSHQGGTVDILETISSGARGLDTSISYLIVIWYGQHRLMANITYHICTLPLFSTTVQDNRRKYFKSNCKVIFSGLPVALVALPWPYRRTELPPPPSPPASPELRWSPAELQ